MQTINNLDELWTKYGDPGFHVENVATIARKGYSENEIVAMKIHGGLYQEVGIGNVVARQIDLQIVPKTGEGEDIPKQARIDAEVKVSHVKINEPERYELVLTIETPTQGAYSVAVPNYGRVRVILPNTAAGDEVHFGMNFLTNTLEAALFMKEIGAYAELEVGEDSGEPPLTEYATITRSEVVYPKEESPIIKKGTFYIKTRDTNTITGVMTIHGFDAMLKAGAAWQGETVTASFPMPVKDAVKDICEKMGVELDSRTVLDERFPVKDFVDGMGYMSMRAVLARIAVANAGNWAITDEGKMRLIPLNPMEENRVDLGNMAENVYPGKTALPFEAVSLLDDSGKVVGKAGDIETTTGRVLEAYNPEGNDIMAEAILEKVRGYVYQPFSADNTVLTPAAELGDVVTVGGVTSTIAQETIYFDSLYTVDISAPANDEIEDEYPYLDEAQKVRRAIAETRAEITKANNEIKLKISKKDAESLIKQNIENIELSVTSSEGGSYFRLSINGVEISSETVDMHVKALNISGDVTAKKLLGEAVQLLTKNGNKAGYMNITGATSADFAVELGSNGAMRLTTGEGNLFAQAQSGAKLNLGGTQNNPTAQIGGALLLTEDSFGTSLPQSPEYGQVYFLKVSN